MIHSVRQLGSVGKRALLCRRYHVIRFETLPRLTIGGEPGDRASVLWAMGALPDGSAEVMGAWLRFGAEQPAWAVISDELSRRGVEQVGVVVAEDLKADVSAFAGNPILVPNPSFNVDWSPLCGLSRRGWCIVERTRLMARSIQAEVVRSLRRKARFGSTADALEATDIALKRAEYRVLACGSVMGGVLPLPETHRFRCQLLRDSESMPGTLNGRRE